MNTLQHIFTTALSQRFFITTTMCLDIRMCITNTCC